eukprot:gene37190-45142_t
MLQTGRVLKFSTAVVHGSFTLPSRKVLKISGQETKKFLQGLCSNDVNKLTQLRQSMGTAFLTPKGRIFATAILHNVTPDANADTSLLLETHQAHINDLKRHLTLYKLRSKVKIESTTYQVAIGTPENMQAANALTYNEDPRSASLGVRAIVEQGSLPSVDEKWYEMRNILEGVVEGPEVSNRIPLECNLDLLNHIAFDKGCYVGQELTARTKYKGLVRKRLVPFLITAKPTSAPRIFTNLSQDLMHELLRSARQPTATGSVAGLRTGCKLYKASDVNSTGQVQRSASAVGEVLVTSSNLLAGMAMVNLEALHAAAPCVFAVVEKKGDGSEEAEGVEIGAAGEGTKEDLNVVGFVSPFKPSWFSGLDEHTNLPV